MQSTRSRGSNDLGARAAGSDLRCAVMTSFISLSRGRADSIRSFEPLCNSEFLHHSNFHFEEDV